MTANNFIRFYYLLLAAILFINGPLLSKMANTLPEYIWLLSPLKESEQHFILGYSLFLLSIALCILNLFRTNKLIRTISCISILTFFSYKYSFGKISHTYHAWLFSSIFMIFADKNLPLLRTINEVVLKFIQITIALFFFNSFMWKVRNFQYDNIEPLFKEMMAQSYINGSLANKAMTLWILDINHNLIFIGFIFFSFIQAMSLIFVLLNRYIKTCGLLLILFHLCVGIIFGIWFWAMAIAILYFFVFMGESEMHNSDASNL